VCQNFNAAVSRCNTSPERRCAAVLCVPFAETDPCAKRRRHRLDIFADRRNQGAAKDRVVTVEEVVAREPDLIIGSWCGKKFRPDRVMARAGFGQVPAVRHQDLYEIKSSLILQPGPAALTDGLAALQKIIEQWAARDNAHRLD
jgi:substrate-binding family protein